MSRREGEWGWSLSALYGLGYRLLKAGCCWFSCWFSCLLVVGFVGLVIDVTCFDLWSAGVFGYGCFRKLMKACLNDRKEFKVKDPVMQKLYVANCINALHQYEIDEAPTIQRRAAALSFNSSDAVEAPTKAAVVGEGLLAFSAHLTDDNRTDAQNAFLFATLVANKKFPLESQGLEWYLLFREVMTNSGWTPVSKYFTDLEVAGTSVRMDKLVLEILSSVVAGLAVPGPATALMLKAAGDAIAALEKRDTALTLYERNLLNHGVGGITAGVCTEVNGEAIMAVGAVRFLRRNTSTKVMFIDVDVRNVKLYKGETIFAKNTELANASRQSIRTKLGLNVVSKIEEYEI